MINFKTSKQLTNLFFLCISIIHISCSYQENRLEYANISASSQNKYRPKKSDIKGVNNKTWAIYASDNFFQKEVNFIIPNDTMINVVAVGEGSDYLMNAALFKSYDNDGIEVYFDMKNEKLPFFDINSDDRQYRILWKSNDIQGQNISTEKLKIYERNLTTNSYQMELTFPWKTLGYVKPKVNNKIGFDIAVMDCDGGTMKALYNWHSHSENSWQNTSYYGSLLLTNFTRLEDSSVIYAQKALYKNNKVNWEKVPTHSFKNVTIGSVKNVNDLSGQFQAVWDNKNLYFMVKVHDDIKSMASALFDYGWIEKKDGTIVWKMKMDDTKYAGGAVKNRIVDTLIRINKGEYRLKYITDESHSPNQWDAPPPTGSFYGIKIRVK